MVLRASSEHDHLHAPAHRLAATTWALLLRLLRHGRPAYTHTATTTTAHTAHHTHQARTAMLHLFQLLPTCWYYLIQPPEEELGQQQGEQQGPDLQGWLPAALPWFGRLVPSAARVLVASLELVMPTLRDLGPLQQVRARVEGPRV